MKTLEQFITKGLQIPTYTVWLLNTLAEYKGKQELFTKQSPEKLKMLREHSIVESAVSSNRIEGVEIEQKRIGTVVFGHGMLADRNEEEVRGYQDALSWIHSEYNTIPFSADTILKLHALTRPEIWDSGRLKEKDGEIIETHPDGRVEIRFQPVAARETPAALDKLCQFYVDEMKNKTIPPLILLAASNLDFLCIHPFRDGNGRISRLLMLLSLYLSGYTAGKYISLERIIESSKERYYETLKASSQGWHDGAHDPWRYINYVLYTLKEMYQEFENKYETTVVKSSEKSSEKILKLIEKNPEITIGDMAKETGLSPRTIEKNLSLLKTSGRIIRKGSKRSGYWEVQDKSSEKSSE